MLTSLIDTLKQLVQVLQTQISGAPAASGGGPAPTPAPDSGGMPPPPPAPPPGTPVAASPPPSQPASNARTGVLLIGDSLTVGAKQFLNEGMAGQPVEIDATGGISLAEGMRRYDAHADKPRVVEMALFTNNSPGQINELRTAVEKTIADARARGGKVVWATIVRPDVGGKSYDEANNMLRDMAAKNADVMGLVDWQKMVADHPNYLAGDKIHSNSAGYTARAQAFADAAK